MNFIIVGAVHFDEILNGGLVGLADQHGIAWIAVREAAHFSEHVMYFGQIVRVLVLNVGIPESIFARKDGIIMKIGVFKKPGNSIYAESRRAPIEPEAHDVIHCFTHFRIAPIQVRLLYIEIVVIPLTGFLVEGPGGMAKPRLPIIRRLSGAFSVTPNVPVALGIGTR